MKPGDLIHMYSRRAHSAITLYKRCYPNSGDIAYRMRPEDVGMVLAIIPYRNHSGGVKEALVLCKDRYGWREDVYFEVIL